VALCANLGTCRRALLVQNGFLNSLFKDLSMPPAYVMVDMQISDMEQYKKYMVAAPESIKAAGGEYLVRGGAIETLEGEWKPARMAMLRFPSYAAAKSWYDGEMYRAARAQRAGATLFFNAVLVEGVNAPV
jgi:uncharacterized protein (DUF1330 family)